MSAIRVACMWPRLPWTYESMQHPRVNETLYHRCPTDGEHSRPRRLGYLHMKWYPMIETVELGRGYVAKGGVKWVQLAMLGRHLTRDDLYVDDNGRMWRPYWVNHRWVGREMPPSPIKKGILWFLVSLLVPGCLILLAVLTNEEMAHWGYATVLSVMFVTISLAIAWRKEIV